MRRESRPIPYWTLLMKFGRREHIEALRDEGLLFANCAEHFSKLEAAKDRVRADPFEGTDRIVQAKDISRFVIESKGRAPLVLGPENFASPLRLYLGGAANCNVYCMYGVTWRRLHAPCDARNFDFGDSFLAVLDTQEFLNRVGRGARERGLNCESRPVRYYDEEKYTGDTGPFRKPRRHAFQNEFRIAFRPCAGEPLLLRIGSIADITTPVYGLADINELIQFREEPPVDMA